MRIFSSCAEIHSTMNSAIIAVTKSAYATFQAPPWCAAAFFLAMAMR